MSKTGAMDIEYIRAVALDLDGVVYTGNSVIVGAGAAIQDMRRRGIGVYFVTNNSGKKREYIAAKLNRMGIDAPVEDIFTSGYAAAFLLSQLHSGGNKRVFVVGSDDLADEVSQVDFKVTDELPCDILLVGFDSGFNYEKLSKSVNALRQGALFVACNRDRTFPVENGQVLPGCGPIVAAIEYAWGEKPAAEAGKPNTLLLEMIASRHKLSAHEILVVGDGIDSDIAMAKRFGSTSILVDTNKEYSKQGAGRITDGSPDMIIESIGDLSRLFRHKTPGHTAET